LYSPDIYKEKLIPVEEAVKKIKSGDRVVIGHACSEPENIIEVMIKNKEAYVKC